MYTETGAFNGVYLTLTDQTSSGSCSKNLSKSIHRKARRVEAVKYTVAVQIASAFKFLRLHVCHVNSDPTDLVCPSSLCRFFESRFRCSLCYKMCYFCLLLRLERLFPSVVAASSAPDEDAETKGKHTQRSPFYI